MGNVCCDQEPLRINHPIRSLTTHRNHRNRTKNKAQKELRFEEQKTLLKEFSSALLYLSQNASYTPQSQFKRFTIGKLLYSERMGLYLKGTLVNEEQIETPCVIKKIEKKQILTKNQKKAIAIQYLATRYLSQHFIVKCIHSYQDESFIYLFYDLTDFRHLIAYTTADIIPELHTRFRLDLQNNIRFLIAGIVLGLQKLHQLKIVYRGMNNQNIVFLPDGYPMLTNLCRLHPQGYTNSQPAQVNHFTSLEQYRAQPMTSATDFWDIGVLIHFICKGKYLNFSTFKENQFKAQDLSLDLVDFVNRLLMLNPANRLGAKDINQLKNHPFFGNFDWIAYSQKQIISPFRYSKTQNNNLPTFVQTKETSFVLDSNEGYQLLGTRLLMSFSTIVMLSQAYQNQPVEQAENIRHESEQDYNQGDQLQLTTQIDIGEQFGGEYGKISGDYD